MRQCGASLDDMKLLLTKYFLIEFETGVIVITHWRMNNYLRGDRYHHTKHTTEYSMLEVKDNKPYVLKDNNTTPNIYVTKSLDLVPDGIPTGIPKTQKTKNTNFIPPTIEEVEAYCQERGNDVDAEKFVAFYSAKGWMIGKNKMKNWKMAVITWEKSGNNYNTKQAQDKQDREDEARGIEHIDDWAKVDKYGNYKP
jgi:hypothetical protein